MLRLSLRLILAFLSLVLLVRIVEPSCPVPTGGGGGGTGGGGGGGGGGGTVVTHRTVIDNEQGSFFDPVPGLQSSAYGYFLMISSNATGASLPPQGIKNLYSRIIGFAPLDDNGEWPYFPYAQFKAYEAAEVAAGRAPLFMTATYQGVRRPLVIVYDLFLNSSGNATTPSNTWHYAVNVGDPRFIKFWLNHYIRPIRWNQVNTTRFIWVGLDETPVKRATLGIVDANGHFVSAVPWDQPFPQTDQAYTTGVKNFFDQAHAIAPEIRLTANVGGMDLPTQFAGVFGAQPGVVFENFWDGPAPVSFIRNFWAPMFKNVSDYGNLGKVVMLRENVHAGGPEITSATALYELVKGPNFFFAPMDLGCSCGVTPSIYQSWIERLGNPTALFTSAPETGKPSGYNFYSRPYDGGTVYLNWSGVSKTISLGGTRYTPTGSAVTSITIPDGVGTFVTLAPTRVSHPQISPRYGGLVKGPLTVTMTSRTAGATMHYTTDGSIPTSASTTYSGPFTVSSSTTVNAIAFIGGQANSPLSTAVYSVTSATPVVSFDHPSDSGRAGDGWGTLSMPTISTGQVVVSYRVLSPTGATVTGSVTIYPDDNFAHLPVGAGGSNGQHFTVTLTSASGATIGSGNTYTYTVQN